RWRSTRFSPPTSTSPPRVDFFSSALHSATSDGRPSTEPPRAAPPLEVAQREREGGCAGRRRGPAAPAVSPARQVAGVSPGGGQTATQGPANARTVPSGRGVLNRLGEGHRGERLARPGAEYGGRRRPQKRVARRGAEQRQQGPAGGVEVPVVAEDAEQH